jgi:hypothetical protein
MPSVIRNRKTGHIFAPGTKAYEERERKKRELEFDYDAYDDEQNESLTNNARRKLPTQKD